MQLKASLQIYVIRQKQPIIGYTTLHTGIYLNCTINTLTETKTYTNLLFFIFFQCTKWKIYFDLHCVVIHM